MSNADFTNGNHYPEDDRKRPKDRVDAHPLYRAGKVERFRKLLAELIARRIIGRTAWPAGCRRSAEAVTV